MDHVHMHSWHMDKAGTKCDYCRQITIGNLFDQFLTQLNSIRNHEDIQYKLITTSPLTTKFNKVKAKCRASSNQIYTCLR